MPALLIISTDTSAAAQIETLADAHAIRTRCVGSIVIAKEWLTRERFDMCLVDVDYGNDMAIAVITHGWQHNSLMIGGLMSLSDSPIDEWYPRLLGIRIYRGHTALSKIQNTLESLASVPAQITADTIMLVEDLESPRTIITSYLQGLGYAHVTGISNANEAISQLLANPDHYFLIITDINMPEVNGIQLIEKVRHDPRLRHLPITVLTSNPTPENLIRCIQNGATGFLAKPPRKRELIREVEKAKRILFTQQSPRVCKPEDAYLLEEALKQMAAS